MAECSHARCMQERRAIKKQLQRWTKNMVYVVGLERVAEELMGRRKWRQLGTIGTWDEDSAAAAAASPSDTSGLPQPLSSGPQDFEPRQDLQCCFCDDPLDASARIASDSEDDSGSVASEGSSSRPFHHNMTTLEAVTSMAASLAAVAALKSSQGANASSAPTSTTSSSPTAGVASLYPLTHHAAAAGLLPAWYLTSPHAAAVAAVAAAQQTPLEPPSLSGSPGPGPGPGPAGFPPSGTSSSSPGTPTGEMPLDLSAKAAALAALAMEREALRVPDSKNIFKARPRANTALSTRRTYTEDELQAALRDIQSGKLGTRRAAVIYGIPRSTLRNKVYKLTMERKCDPTALMLAAGADPCRLPLAALALPPDDEDGVLSGGEDDQDKPLKLDSPMLGPESLRLLLQQGLRREGSEEGASSPPPGLPPPFAGAEGWNLDYQALAPYISKILGAHQSLMAARNVPPSASASGDSPGAESPGSRDGSAADFLPKFASPLLPDFLYRMMADEREQHQRSSQFHNGSSGGGDRDEKQGSSSPAVSKSETEDDGAPGSARAPTPPNVILKIPSFKPTSKNGGVPLDAAGVFSRCSSSSSPVIGQPGPGPQSGESSQHSETSPTPLGGSSSPPANQSFANKALAAKFPHLRLGPTSPIFDLKRGHYAAPPSHHALTESVIKSMQQQHQAQQPQAGARNSSQSAGGGGSSNSGQPASGKGTRPKRGKYRNYDRDALNEAVKAVQRGEMSVHRAGSFYGVPHSTLEYKVKERHLMRPRKRDPKPAPAPEEKPKQDGNVLRMPAGDKLPLPGTSKPKPFIQPPLGAPQNGLKPPRFDRFDPANIPSLAAAYTGISPFPFWGPGYAPLSLDFSAPPSFNANTTKQFLTSQMMQRLQESQDGSRSGSAGSGVGPPAGQGSPGGAPGPGPGPGLGPGSGPGSGPGQGASALALGLKRSRDMAESMDDSSGEHATLLDGIIRYGLEKGLPSANKEAVENLSNKALLDQLCRNSRLDSNRIDAPRLRASSSSEDDEVRRPPLSLIQPGVVPLSPSTDEAVAEEREEKNCKAYDDGGGGGGAGTREDDDRPRRPTSGAAEHTNPNSFQLNHSPPHTARADQDNERPNSQPSVNGLGAARSDELVKSACDSKLKVDSRVSGAGPEEDGAKDSSEDQVRDEDTKTQEIS